MYRLITIYFFFILIISIPALSQDKKIENTDSPNSVNVLGDNNTINYDSQKVQDELLERYLKYNLSEEKVLKIFKLISKENKSNIPDSVIDGYSKTLLNIYKEIAPNSLFRLGDTVMSPISKNKHVFDVISESIVLGHKVVIAFRLLPLDRPATISDILDFKMSLDDIKAIKGVVICNEGFTKELKQFASDNLIDLCSLLDSRSRLWKEDIKIPIIWVKPIPNINSNIGFNAADGDEKRIPSEITHILLTNDYGKSFFTIQDIVIERYNEGSLPIIADSAISIDIDTSDLYLITFDNNGRKVKSMDISYTIKEEHYLRYFNPSNYIAIKDDLTNEFKISKMIVELENFEDMTKWKKICRGNKEDCPNGSPVDFPNKIFITITNYKTKITKEDFNVSD